MLKEEKAGGLEAGSRGEPHVCRSHASLHNLQHSQNLQQGPGEVGRQGATQASVAGDFEMNDVRESAWAEPARREERARERVVCQSKQFHLQEGEGQLD